eukprot:Skav226023  [mRNA]  locus=scaffold2502:33187:33589:+ [translate_table: standard]
MSLSSCPVEKLMPWDAQVTLPLYLGSWKVLDDSHSELQLAQLGQRLTSMFSLSLLFDRRKGPSEGKGPDAK